MRSGHNKSDVEANTKASQDYWLAADQSQTVMAGRGGEGGSGNKAEGGDVHFKAGIESATLKTWRNSHVSAAMLAREQAANFSEAMLLFAPTIRISSCSIRRRLHRFHHAMRGTD
jgi:hypothetical protein